MRSVMVRRRLPDVKDREACFRDIYPCLKAVACNNLYRFSMRTVDDLMGEFELVFMHCAAHYPRLGFKELRAVTVKSCFNRVLNLEREDKRDEYFLVDLDRAALSGMTLSDVIASNSDSSGVEEQVVIRDALRFVQKKLSDDGRRVLYQIISPSEELRRVSRRAEPVRRGRGCRGQRVIGYSDIALFLGVPSWRVRREAFRIRSLIRSYFDGGVSDGRSRIRNSVIDS